MRVDVLVIAGKKDNNVEIVFKKQEFENARKNMHSAHAVRDKIAGFLFHNTQVFARHLHIVWSWKWFAVKVSCIHSYRDWYIHKRWYIEDARQRLVQMSNFYLRTHGFRSTTIPAVINSKRFTGVSAQPTQDLFRYRRTAFYSGLKSKVGLIAAKLLPPCVST